MREYVTKPQTIWAEQWDGTQEGAGDVLNNIFSNSSQDASFVGVGEGHMLRNSTNDVDSFIVIEVDQDDRRMNPFDWLVRGVTGTFFPVSRDQFARNYEEKE